MVAIKDYVARWINISVNDFLGDTEEPPQSMSHALITCVGRNPEVFSVFQFLKDQAENNFPTLLVPTLCVGMPSWTLRVLFRAATTHQKTTQSVQDGIPTEDRGNE
jgi:hypothetical protein